MVTKEAPSHWIGNTNTRTSAMPSICPHTATLVRLLGLWCHSSHSSTCVCDEGWDGNHRHFNTACGTHTSETVMGGTPHACPCFIHSMMCATTTTLRDTSEAWWHQHTHTHLDGSAVWCVWPMCCHSCVHHHLHAPFTFPPLHFTVSHLHSRACV